MGIFRILYMLCICLFFTYAVDDHFFQENSDIFVSTMNVIMFVGILIFMIKFHKISEEIKEKSIRVCSFILSFLYSLCMVFGKSIDETNSLSGLFAGFGTALVTIMSITAFTVVFGMLNMTAVWGYRRFITWFEKRETVKDSFLNVYNKISDKLWKIWLIIFICWIPAFISYFPGIFSYDMPYQTWQVAGLMDYNRHHPPTHTFLWAGCFELEKLTGIAGITIYGILQMIFMSLVTAWFIRYMKKKDFHPFATTATLVFFALNPVIAICSFIPAKDFVFSIFFLMFTVFSVNLIKDVQSGKNSLKDNILFAVSILLCCLFRNNAFYCLLLSAPFFCILLRAKWKKILILFILPLLLYQVIDRGVYGGLMDMDPSEDAEMLSVPFVQVANVVANEPDALTEEERALLSKCIDPNTLADVYNPRLVDTIKMSYDQNGFMENKDEFVSLWFSLLGRYPGRYIDAFLSLNLPYWYPDANTLDEYSGKKYIETDIYETDYTSYKRKGYLPWLNFIYEGIASYEPFEYLPVISNIFSITTPLWIILIALFAVIGRKKYKWMCAILPSLFLMLTFLLGPVSNFRYIFEIVMLYPFYLLIIFSPKKLFEENDIDRVIVNKMEQSDLQTESEPEQQLTENTTE